MNIYTIAELAGVAPSTVSKVINNKGSVSDGTRKRILQIVSQNNFQPRLCSNVASNVAVVFRRSQGNIFYSSYASQALAGISDYFIDKNQNILLLNSEKIPHDRSQFQTFCHRNHIDGMIFLDIKSIDTYVSFLSGIVPFVVLNDTTSGTDLYCIAPDDFCGSYSAMQYLLEMGHTRIAFSYLDQQYWSHKQRLLAYKSALQDYGIPLNSRYLIDDEKVAETPFRMLFDSWRQLGDMPTAIFCTNDDTAVMLISHLHQLNVNIPDDISLVGFDDYSYAIHLSPALTTVRQPITEIGKSAARIIDERINKPTAEPPQAMTFLPEELIIRHSVRKIGDPVKKCANPSVKDGDTAR